MIPAALIEALAEARHVCVLTGAGVSAESGVPTFRDAQDGLWADYNPLELATREGFSRDPALVWRWYRWRRELVAGVVPNAGHTALAELAGMLPRLTLVTQNVDGLHQRAGSADVIEFHGNLFVDRCFDCGRPGDAADEELPRCEACGGLLRPGVVWFGEAIPSDAIDRAFAAAADCEMFLSIGTSALVYPAAGLIDIARENGAVCAEINPDPTEQAASVHFAVAGESGRVLPELLGLLAS
ncbi:MAG: NAD-dependent deacylase [Woeseiaceae bacterium]|nr:NAD-dependent deacylase [Woeseiaceae bacterium]